MPRDLQGRAFKDQVTSTMSITQIMDILIASKLTTAEEETFTLGRNLTMPLKREPRMDAVWQRIAMYTNKLAFAFSGDEAKGFKLPPMDVLGPGGKAMFALQFDENGQPVHLPPGQGKYGSVEMGEGRPILFTWPGQTPRLPLDELEEAKKMAKSKSLSGQGQSTDAPVKKLKAKKKSCAVDSMVTPVHPSTLLAFPDITNPPADEVDNHPLISMYKSLPNFLIPRECFGS